MAEPTAPEGVAGAEATEQPMKPVDIVRSKVQAAKDKVLESKKGDFERIKAEIAQSKIDLNTAETSVADSKEALKELNGLNEETMRADLELPALKAQLEKDLAAAEQEVEDLKTKIKDSEADPLYLEVSAAENARTNKEAADAEASKKAVEETDRSARELQEQREMIEAIGNFALKLQDILQTFKEESERFKTITAEQEAQYRTQKQNLDELGDTLYELEQKAWDNVPSAKRKEIMSMVSRDLGHRTATPWITSFKENVKASKWPLIDSQLKAYQKLLSSPLAQELQNARIQVGQSGEKRNATIKDANDNISSTKKAIALLTLNYKNLQDQLPRYNFELPKPGDPLRQTMKQNLENLSAAIEKATKTFGHNDSSLLQLGNLGYEITRSRNLFEQPL